MRRIPAALCLYVAASTSTLIAFADTWLVLPLSNLSGKPSIDWIGESAAESIAEALTREGMLVIDREDRKEGERRLALRSNAQWTRASILKLAESLDANRVLFGTFEVDLSPGPSGVGSAMGTLKLTAQDINVRDLRRGGSAIESGPLEDLASLQTRLAWKVLTTSGPKSVQSEEQFLLARADIRLDAIENYIRGLLAASRETQERYFQQALKLESRYSQAAFQYGKLLYLKNNYNAASAALEKVQNWDPHYREAGFLLGLAKFGLGDFRAAEAAFQRVSREVPLSEVLNNLGVAQLRLGLAEGLENLRRALEGDDKDPTYHFNLGVGLLLRGAYAAAADQFRATLDRDPNDQEATKFLGRSLRPATSALSKEDLAGAERLKLGYEEAAYQQLKALIKPQKK